MLLKVLIRFLVTAGILLALPHFIPGIVVSSFLIACLAALVWGIISLTVRPILKILTLPLNILTLGLFSFILNALLFWVMSLLVPGFTVAGFIPALEGSFVLSLATMILHAVL